MDSMGKIVKKPVAWVEVINDGRGHYYCFRGYYFGGIELLPAGKHNLFVAPPAPAVTTQDLDDFLSRVQARVIELGYMPPAWPTSERDGTDDPVEAAARMICGLMDAVKTAPAVRDSKEYSCAPVMHREQIQGYIDEVIYRLMGGLLSKQINRDDIQSAMLAASKESS